MKLKLYTKNSIHENKPTIDLFIGMEVYNISSKKNCKIIKSNGFNSIDIQYEDGKIEKNQHIDCFFLI